MQATTPAVTWPPRVGDYARVRASGTLGEVIEVAGCARDRRYTLNLFQPGTGAPPILTLDDLAPVWPIKSTSTQHEADGRTSAPIPAPTPAWAIRARARWSRPVRAAPVGPPGR